MTASTAFEQALTDAYYSQQYQEEGSDSSPNIVAAVGTAATVTGVGLTAAGFTANGIAAGSLAAGIQSGIGNVLAGSNFAALQSIGATGGFVAMALVGVIAFFLSFVF